MLPITFPFCEVDLTGAEHTKNYVDMEGGVCLSTCAAAPAAASAAAASRQFQIKKALS